MGYAMYAYPISYRSLEEVMQERGVEVDKSSEKITIDKPTRQLSKATTSITAGIEIRQVKYLNNIGTMP